MLQLLVLLLTTLSISKADLESDLQIPTTSGLNQAFSRIPHEPSYNKERRELTLEGLISTIKHDPKGNNTRFVIAKVRLSEDGKHLESRCWYIQEGRPGIRNNKNMILSTEVPYSFTIEDVGKLTFEMSPEKELVRLTLTIYNKEDKTTSQELIYPRKWNSKTYTKIGKRNRTSVREFLMPGWSIFYW